MIRLGSIPQRRSKGSLPAALIGILLFLGSFVTLWVNEGRTDLSTIARNATVFRSDSAPAEAQEQLVGITGPLAVSEPAGDLDFGVRGNYLFLERKVEMYAWKEKSEDNNRYSYSTEWTTRPEDSSSFHQAGHTNPPMPYQGRSFYAGQGQVGPYTFDPSRAHLIAKEEVALGSDLRLPRGARISGSYIYIGAGSPTQPQVGDVRISYSAVLPGRTVTLYGKLVGQHVEPYVRDGDTLYGIWGGGHEEAMAAMHQEYVIMGWVLRLVGFLMMWFGMNMVVSPLTNLLGYVPILGRLGRAAIWGVTFLIALVFTLVTIVISFIAHRWYLLLAVVVIAIGVTVFLVMRKQKKEPAAVS